MTRPRLLLHFCRARPAPELVPGPDPKQLLAGDGVSTVALQRCQVACWEAAMTAREPSTGSLGAARLNTALYNARESRTQRDRSVMESLPSDLLDELNFQRATEEEATSWRNHLPPEPWQAPVEAAAHEVGEWVKSRLEAGVPNARGAVVSVRKAGQSTRPVPIVGVAERIAYRALTDHLLEGVPPAARSVEDYRRFATGPISYGVRSSANRFRRISDSKITHVVESDVTAFYQYVDHETLRQELVLQTGRVKAAEALRELLREISGASYGLPQMLDASDELSEIYIRILERDIARRGIPVWRYNDDFRIAVNSYEAAQSAVEQLSESAASLGLVLGEHKTYISRFSTYFMRYADVEDPEELERFDPDAVFVDSGYVLEPDQAVEVAIGTLARLDLPPGDPARIDLKSASGADLRQLRRALSILRAAGDPAALERTTHLMLFTPSLTPRVCEYLSDLHTGYPDDVAASWEALYMNHSSSLSQWQLAWLTYVARTADLLQGHPERIAAVKRQQLKREHVLLHAEACLTLSEVAAVPADELDRALRTQPEPLVPWYVLAVGNMRRHGAIEAGIFNAVRDSSPFWRTLLGER